MSVSNSNQNVVLHSSSRFKSQPPQRRRSQPPQLIVARVIIIIAPFTWPARSRSARSAACRRRPACCASGRGSESMCLQA